VDRREAPTGCRLETRPPGFIIESSGEVEIDENICAMVFVRISGSRTCNFVEGFQDQKVGGERASQISRPGTQEDRNRCDPHAKPVAKN